MWKVKGIFSSSHCGDRLALFGAAFWEKVDTESSGVDQKYNELDESFRSYWLFGH